MMKNVVLVVIATLVSVKKKLVMLYHLDNLFKRYERYKVI